jgi:protein-tyrosine kinase
MKPNPEYRHVYLTPPSGSSLLPFDGHDTPVYDQYRSLRTHVLRHPSSPSVIALTSPSPGDGKTTTSINLTRAIASRVDCSVLLIDADMRRPAVDRLLGLDKSPGLPEYLGGEASLDQVILRVGQLPSMYVLRGGQCSHPTDLIDSPRWHALIDEARHQFRYVIVDGTPIGLVADFDLVQASCDGVVLVIRPEHTNRQLCAHAMQAVMQDKLLGVVLNAVPEWRLWRTRDYYGALSYSA